MPATDWRSVRVPRTWQVEPEHTEYRRLAWYLRAFDAPQTRSDFTLRLEFEAVFHTATVWVNGKGSRAAFRQRLYGLYARYRPPIALRIGEYGGREVDNAFTESMLPRGRSIDWAHDGGIYRPVQLLVTPKVFIARVDVEAEPDLLAGTASIAGGAACPLLAV